MSQKRDMGHPVLGLTGSSPTSDVKPSDMGRFDSQLSAVSYELSAKAAATAV